MARHNADLETDLFFAEGRLVKRRGLVEVRETDNVLSGTHTDTIDICEVEPDAPEGTAEQIARALNRLPKAEAMLLDVTGKLRAVDEETPSEDIRTWALTIEEWMCS